MVKRTVSLEVDIVSGGMRLYLGMFMSEFLRKVDYSFVTDIGVAHALDTILGMHLYGFSIYIRVTLFHSIPLRLEF